MKGRLTLGLVLMLILVSTISAQVPVGRINVSFDNDGSTVVVGTSGTGTAETNTPDEDTQTPGQDTTATDVTDVTDTGIPEMPEQDPVGPSITKIDDKDGKKKTKDKPKDQEPTEYVPAEPAMEKVDETINFSIFELKVSDLRHAGYQGPVSAFVTEMNEQTKEMKTEIREEIKDKKLEEKVTKNIGRRAQARVLQMTAEKLEISQTELKSRISDIDEEAADEVTEMPKDFQRLVYVVLEHGAEEDKTELEAQIKNIDQEFQIWKVPFKPEDFDNLDPDQIMDMITG